MSKMSIFSFFLYCVSLFPSLELVSFLFSFISSLWILMYIYEFQFAHCFQVSLCLRLWFLLFPLYYFSSFPFNRNPQTLLCSHSLPLFIFYKHGHKTSAVFGEDTLGENVLLSVVQWAVCSKEKHLRWKGVHSGVEMGVQLTHYGNAPFWEGSSLPPVCFSLSLLPVFSLPGIWLYFLLVLKL